MHPRMPQALCLPRRIPDVVFLGSYFEGNIAKRVGGALSLHETSHTVRIEYTTFKDNRAGLYGGAYFVRKAVQTLGYGKSHAKNIIFYL